MAHQSGINASAEFGEFLKTARDGNYRSFKVKIEDEFLVLSGSSKSSGTFEQDFDSCVVPYVEDNSPCFIMVRFDEKNVNDHYLWLYIQYSPDTSSVRDKMTYASTRMTYKRIFGSDILKDEFFTNNKNEVNLKGYKEHVRSNNAPPPLTDSENMMKETKLHEKSLNIVSSKDAGLPGIAVPVSEDSKEALKDLISGKINYVQLAVDIKGETIVLKKQKKCTAEDIPTETPRDEPCYHILAFTHEFEGSSITSMVFIYSIPDSNCSIKKRMVFSSCKSCIIQYYENNHGNFDKKIETSEIAEINSKMLHYELHPPKLEAKKTFEKPRKPGR